MSKGALKRIILTGNLKKDEAVCQICRKKIKKGEPIVGILTASFFATYKDFFVCHESCFLIEIVNMFKYKIKLTKRMKDKLVADRI